MDFSDALRLLKAGRKITNFDWHRRGGAPGQLPFISMTAGATVDADKIWSPHNRAVAERIGGCIEVLPAITYMSAAGQIMMGWAPSQADLFSDNYSELVDVDAESQKYISG